jgi:hypothetical protein
MTSSPYPPNNGQYSSPQNQGGGYGAPQQPQYPGSGDQAPQYSPAGSQAPQFDQGAYAGGTGGTGGVPPEPPKKKWPWIVAGCGCLALIAIVIAIIIGVFVVNNDGDEDPTTPPTTETTEPETTDPETTEPETTEPETTEPETTEPETTEPESDNTVSDDDLEDSKQLVVDWYKAFANKDWEKACGYMYDYIDGNGMSEGSLMFESCVDGYESGDTGEDFSGTVDAISTDLFDAEVKDDTTILVTAKQDDSLELYVVRGDDGNLYIDFLGA